MSGEFLNYVSNPKHKEPWQRGRKGVLCPSWSHKIAQALLAESEVHPNTNKKARYATHDGLAFEAYPDNRGGWHGYPVGWHEVPDKIRNKWLREKRIQRRHVRKYNFLQPDEKGRIVG